MYYFILHLFQKFEVISRINMSNFFILYKNLEIIYIPYIIYVLSILFFNQRYKIC